MTVWLRRVGAANGEYELPHQAKDAIRIMVWVDDPWHLTIRKYGHLWLPVDHSAWTPALEIETDFPGPIIKAELETTPDHLVKVPEPPLRPYSFVFQLPSGAGNCFKLLEKSYHRFKHSFCLPPASKDTVCRKLAPPSQYTAAAPALWLAIGPIRHTNSPRLFTEQAAQIAQRLDYYVSYHVAMGGAGLLLYADELARDYLLQNSQAAAMLRAGTLRFVDWELPEREHEDTDGLGRMLGYNYDQALVAGHLFLGLSACGLNLVVLISDLDEYLYSPQPDVRWPMPFGTCIPPRNKAGDLLALHTLSRVEVLSSTVKPEDEARLWISPGGLAERSPQTATVGQHAVHPLAHYDLIYRKPMKVNHNKPISVPASQIVAFFVHEGTPLQVNPLVNASRAVPMDCLVLLHLPNYFRQRTTSTATYVKLEESQFRPFDHWLIRKDGGFSVPTRRPRPMDALMGGFTSVSGHRAVMVKVVLLWGLALVLCVAVAKLMSNWYRRQSHRRWRH